LEEIPVIKHTFCHLPGIGIGTERRLWDSGLHSWEQVFEPPAGNSRPKIRRKLNEQIHQSQKELESSNFHYFADSLPANQHWRLYPYFKNSMAYVDIETTGLDYGSSITTIALYDGKSVFHYVNGKNLPDFKKDIRRYKVIVTYNGKCFDVPFLERFFRIQLDQIHIDLRYLLSSLGYSGGLKGCEAKLGLSRGELEGIDGFFAVYLWHEYQRNHNQKALETLLAYNIADVLNLEQLLTIAYNRKLKETPFYKSNSLKIPEPKSNPFKPDARTVRKIKEKFYYSF
jgi:uncharacterized protein